MTHSFQPSRLPHHGRLASQGCTVPLCQPGKGLSEEAPTKAKAQVPFGDLGLRACALTAWGDGPKTAITQARCVPRIRDFTKLARKFQKNILRGQKSSFPVQPLPTRRCISQWICWRSYVEGLSLSIASRSRSQLRLRRSILLTLGKWWQGGEDLHLHIRGHGRPRRTTLCYHPEKKKAGRSSHSYRQDAQTHHSHTHGLQDATFHPELWQGELKRRPSSCPAFHLPRRPFRLPGWCSWLQRSPWPRPRHARG